MIQASADGHQARATSRLSCTSARNPLARASNAAASCGEAKVRPVNEEAMGTACVRREAPTGSAVRPTRGGKSGAGSPACASACARGSKAPGTSPKPAPVVVAVIAAAASALAAARHLCASSSACTAETNGSGCNAGGLGRLLRAGAAGSCARAADSSTAKGGFTLATSMEAWPKLSSACCASASAAADAMLA